MAERTERDEGVVTKRLPKKKSKLDKPKLFKVLLHNDDYTTREFVVDVLMGVFHKSEADAIDIMLKVHHQGVGVAGIYTFEVAETKVNTVHALAKQHEFPLMLSMEPEE